MVLGNGQRKWLDTWATEREAGKEKAALLGEAASNHGPTIEEAIAFYGEILRSIENQERSIETTLGRLRTFFKSHLGERAFRLARTARRG
jgi:hypothetical protein